MEFYIIEELVTSESFVRNTQSCTSALNCLGIAERLNYGIIHCGLKFSFSPRGLREQESDSLSCVLNREGHLFFGKNFRDKIDLLVAVTIIAVSIMEKNSGSLLSETSRLCASNGFDIVKFFFRLLIVLIFGVIEQFTLELSNLFSSLFIANLFNCFICLA